MIFWLKNPVLVDNVLAKLDFGRPSVQPALVDVVGPVLAVPSGSGPPAGLVGPIRSEPRYPAPPRRNAPVAPIHPFKSELCESEPGVRATPFGGPCSPDPPSSPSKGPARGVGPRHARKVAPGVAAERKRLLNRFFVSDDAFVRVGVGLMLARLVYEPSYGEAKQAELGLRSLYEEVVAPQSSGKLTQPDVIAFLQEDFCLPRGRCCRAGGVRGGLPPTPAVASPDPLLPRPHSHRCRLASLHAFEHRPRCGKREEQKGKDKF